MNSKDNFLLLMHNHLNILILNKCIDFFFLGDKLPSILYIPQLYYYYYSNDITHLYFDNIDLNLME